MFVLWLGRSDKSGFWYLDMDLGMDSDCAGGSRADRGGMARSANRVLIEFGWGAKMKNILSHSVLRGHRVILRAPQASDQNDRLECGRNAEFRRMAGGDPNTLPSLTEAVCKILAKCLPVSRNRKAFVFLDAVGKN